MSDIKDLDYYNNWLENSISNGHIKYYEYLDFKNIKLIGNGASGNVFCATWKNTETILALKTFNNLNPTLKEVVKEVKRKKFIIF